MILVDSSVWIDYFNGKITPQTDRLDQMLGREIIIIGDIILTEVLQGFKSDRDFDHALELLSNFQVMDMLGQHLAIESAKNYRLLRKRGVTVRKTIDIMIATFCIHYNIALLHDDRDFYPLVKHINLRTV